METYSKKIQELINNARNFQKNYNYLDSLEEYKNALDLINNEKKESENIEKATVYNNIASLYVEMGKYDEALSCYAKALPVFEEFFGYNHINNISIYVNIALVYLKTGNYERARKYCCQSLEALSEKTNPLQIAVYNTLGQIDYAMGFYENSIRNYKNAISVSESLSETDSTLIATTYNNMASVFRAQGSYTNALEYYKKALAIKERVLGANHPETATMYNNIGLLYSAQGNYEEALEYYWKNIAISKSVLGTEHPDIATTYNNIAGVYYQQGDYEKAREYYSEALVISERVLGTEHPYTATTYNNLAGVYEDQGDYVKAREYYSKALAISERVLGTEHPDTATTYNNIALVYYNLGEFEKALEYYGKALAIRERVLGAEHPSTVVTYKNMAGVYYQQGDYENAIEYYKEAIAISEGVLGTERPSTATTYYNIARVYEKRGDNKTALEYSKKGATRNAGMIGNRAFIIQSIIAMVECLDRDDWDEIKIEPDTANGKTDVILYKDGGCLSAIQVKSSINAFEKNEVAKWLEQLEEDAKGAKDVLLYLVGDSFKPLCETFIWKNRNKLKKISISHLLDVYTGKMAAYVKKKGLGEQVTINDLELIDDSLFAKIHKNSIAKEPMSRTAFETAFQKAISVNICNENQLHVPKCLTPIPAVNQTVGLIGRDEIVKTVRTLLEEKNRIVLVNGIGGIGKTAVMQQVCNELKDEGHYVAWIKWDNSLKDGLLLLRDGLGVPKGENKDQAYELVVNTIKNHLDGKLYLFIDDLTRRLDGHEISLLNSLQIHVMLTSRFECESLKNLYLKALERDAVIDMFFVYYNKDRNPKDEISAWNIINFVHSNTLLVELLAKAARAEGGTLDRFYNTLKDKGFFEASDEEVISEHDGKYRSVEKTIMKLYEMSKLSKDEQHIMRLFTIFSPEKAIYSKVIDWSGFDRKAMRRLVDAGWLDREGGYIIHKVVKDSLSRQLGIVRLEDYGDLLDKVIDTDSYLSVTETYDVVRERCVLTEDIATFLWEEYQSDGEKDKKWVSYAGALFNNIAGVYKEQGEYGKALEYYGKALAIRERVLGTEHPDTAATYNNLALAYDIQGEYRKALEYYGKALAIRERVLGMEHPDTAATYNNIAVVYQEQGEYGKALEYYGKALTIRERMLGTEHPSTAATYNNIAVAYGNQGDYGKALEYYGKALVIRERMLGTEHPSTAATYNNIAVVYGDQGDYGKALEYSRKALAIRERVLGTEHPDTAATYNNIAGLLRAQGDYKKAMEFFKKALDVYKAVFGENHPYTKKIRNNMDDLLKL